MSVIHGAYLECKQCDREVTVAELYVSKGRRPLGICRNCFLSNRRELYSGNREHRCSKERARLRRLKQTVMDAYGGKCAECGVTELVFLTIDHIKDNGAEERRNGMACGDKLYAYLRREGYPNGYQVLCYNCNWIKRTKIILPVVSAAKRRIREVHALKRANLKREVMDAYGSECVCCGEDNILVLNIDHILNNGTQWRRENGDTYYWLKRHGFPQEDFQILCSNCNCAKRDLGTCPHAVMAYA